MTTVLPASKVPKNFLKQLLQLQKLSPKEEVFEIAFEIRTTKQPEKLEESPETYNSAQEFIDVTKSWR